MLRGEHLAGTANARLHFIENKQDAVFVAERPQTL